MAGDLYSVLGVPRSADTPAIKKAYRKLAAKYHPDRNPGAANEKRFKEVASAYEVLGDEEKRTLYDEFGEDSMRSGFDAERARALRDFGYARGGTRGGGGGFGGGAVNVDLSDLFGGRGGGGDGDLGDMLGDLFRRTRSDGPGPAPAPRARRGHNTKSTVTIDFADAVKGTTLKLTSRDDGKDSLTVRIPAGADDGSRVRLKGKGGPGINGGPAGDLLLTIKVTPHKHFVRDGKDIYLDLPITVSEAYTGAQVQIPTAHGPVKLSVPQGTQSGQKMRLRGKGIVHKNKQPGDMYVRFLVVYPASDDDKIKAAIATLGAETKNPRLDIEF